MPFPKLLVVCSLPVWLCLYLCPGCSSNSSQAPALLPARTSQSFSTSQPGEVAVNDALVQFSLIASLAAGDYADGAPLHDVLANGDFAIGTFNRLDGEMIVLDGQMYQALADGTLRQADLDSTTPFAVTTFFQEDGRIEHLSTAALKDLDEALDRSLPRRNAPYAIRIDGEFNKLTLRSVPAQSPPFQSLVNVVKHQSTWQHRHLRGTLVGFRCPAWVGLLNVPGYHWHFLSDDRNIGGHVLDCEFGDALLRFDDCTSILIRLPDSARFESFHVDEVKKQDINDIERQRTLAH